MVGEARSDHTLGYNSVVEHATTDRSDQSAGHVSPLLDLKKKSELEGDVCRVNHAEERPILLSVPG